MHLHCILDHFGLDFLSAASLSLSCSYGCIAPIVSHNPKVLWTFSEFIEGFAMVPHLFDGLTLQIA
jgi:hypothetical protein